MSVLDWTYFTDDEWTEQQRAAIDMAVEKMVQFGAGTADAIFRDKDKRVVAGFSVCPVAPDTLAGVVMAVDVHHLDENEHNNDPDNLLLVCEGCHNARHRPWEKRWGVAA